MTTGVIAGARQTVPAPVRKPRRFGLFSVVTPIDGGDSHWMMGGLTADGEECSIPETGEVGCGPTADKLARSWFSDIEGDPWVSYMFETCKPVGRRFDEVTARLRSRFLASEQSAVELGLSRNVLSLADNITGGGTTVASVVGQMEKQAALLYGAQIILHMTPLAANEAARHGLLRQVGDHLETWTGNLVSIGNYGGDTTDTPTMYGTGALDLYRSELVEVPPTFNTVNNDYFALIERAYAALVDCWMLQAPVPLCDCGGGGAPI